MRSASSMMSFGTESTPRLVLDTSAYSQFRRGHRTTLDFIAGADVVYVPATVLGELEAGFELGSRPEENRQTLAEFLAEPFVTPLSVTTTVARHYGKIFAALRRHGTPIPINDVWIAASTLDSAAHLLTFDDDYRNIEWLDCTILAP